MKLSNFEWCLLIGIGVIGLYAVSKVSSAITGAETTAENAGQTAEAAGQGFLFAATGGIL